MSAFVVTDRHTSALVDAALVYGGQPFEWRGQSAPIDGSYSCLDADSAEAVGAMLLKENERSVAHLYNETPAGEVGFVYRRGAALSQVEALKLLDGYEYQSCETPDWEETEAHRFCQLLRKRIIHRLHGYEEAPWSL